MAFTNRYAFLDSTRGLAVFLAVLIHAVRSFGYDFTPGQDLIFLITRTATPILLIVFGVMVEIVYLRKLREGVAVVDMRKRLIQRAITCYLLYLAVGLTALASGKIGLEQALRMAVSLAPAPLAQILFLYAILLAGLALLLPAMARWGAGAMLAVGALGWAMKLALAPLLGAEGYGLVAILGIGKGFAPAIVLCPILVAFGMLIGERLTGRRRAIWPLGIAGAAVLAVGLAINDKGLLRFAEEFIQIYRWTNHPLYYAYGITAASMALLGFHLAWRQGGGPVARICARLGQHALFFYVAGNVALNLVPDRQAPDLEVIVLTAGFMALLTLVSLDRAAQRSVIAWVSGGVFRQIQRIYDGWVRELAGRISAMMPAGGTFKPSASA
ncbi:MAG: hypothetical protein AAGI13_06415 [Pseudomonadota bacterium]